MTDEQARMPRDELVAALRGAGCVFAEEEAGILWEAASSAAELAAMLAARVGGRPLEHIVGWAEFRGLRISVAPGVFVPRRRSGFLVERAMAVLADPAGGRRPLVLDLCCGSGAVGAALASELQAQGSVGREFRGSSGCELHAADIAPAAMACAAANIAPFQGRAHCGDLFDALPESLRGRFDVIVANAPYVPSASIDFMPQEARLYEPDEALNGGTDGLDLHRRIAAGASGWLRPGGALLLESSARQATATAGILASNGFSTGIAASPELEGTVVTGRLADPSYQR